MFKISIETGGSAFGREDDEYAVYELRNEINRICTNVMNELQDGHRSGVCMDLLGNKVGTWTLEDERN